MARRSTISHRRKRLELRFAAMIAFAFECSPILAGPPLSIDDPGILQFGQIELITAVTMTSDGSGNFHELPLLDVSVGLVQDYVQISAGLAHVYVAPDGNRSEKDFGNPSLGLKYRFMNGDRLQLAFAPGYIFGVTNNAAERGVGHSENVAVLPFDGEYRINDAWRVNGEVGYARFDGGQSEWGYGVAMAYSFDARRELLFELSGGGNNFLDSDFVQARVGIDNSVSDAFSILFSMGTGLRAPTPSDKVDFDVYLGIKLLH